MADNIGTLLRDAAADPKHTPDFDGLANRGRRQHLAARAGTALAVALALVAGSIVVWPSLLPSRMPIIGEGPTTPTGVEDVELPDGWQRVEIGRAVFGVPGDWTLETFTEPAHVCQNYAQRATVFVLHAGPPDGDHICRLIGMQATTLTAMPLSRIPATLLPDPGPQWSDITTPAGVAGQRANLSESKALYRFPALDLWLQFDSPGPLGLRPDDILATLVEQDPAATQQAAPEPTSCEAVSEHDLEGCIAASELVADFEGLDVAEELQAIAAAANTGGNSYTFSDNQGNLLVEVDPRLCGWVALTAEDIGGAWPVARRAAVHYAIGTLGEYDGDGLYWAVGAGCAIAGACDDRVVEVDSPQYDLPSDDAPWPCGAGDYL